MMKEPLRKLDKKDCDKIQRFEACISQGEKSTSKMLHLYIKLTFETQDVASIWIEMHLMQVVASQMRGFGHFLPLLILIYFLLDPYSLSLSIYIYIYIHEISLIGNR